MWSPRNGTPTLSRYQTWSLYQTLKAVWWKPSKTIEWSDDTAFWIVWLHSWVLWGEKKCQVGGRLLLQQFTHAIPLHTNLKASLKKKRHNFLILNALSAVYQSVNELLICHYNFSILIPTPFLTHSSPKPCYRTHNHYRIYNQKIYDLHQACRFCDHQDCQICAHVGMLQWPKMSNCYCE